jgi:large subunit ribosomal protein L25
MPQQTELEIAPRTVTGKATKHLRKQGIIPANIYGHKEPSLAVQVEAVAFSHLRRAHASRQVLNLKLSKGKTQMALIRHIQYDAVKGGIVHIDFARVSLSERITIKVPLRVVGDAPGVKIAGGVLLSLLEALEIECQAGDIVESIEVDISSLAALDSLLHARDVPLPKSYTLITDPEEPVAKIATPRATAETGAPAAAPAPEAAPAPAQKESASSES